MNPPIRNNSLAVLKDLVALHEKNAQPKDEGADLVTLKGLCELHSIAQREMAHSLRSIEIGDALRPSIFDLMEHNFRENTHSNVLEYVFDCHRGAWGRTVLCAFLDTLLPMEAEKWNESTAYEIAREHDLRVGNDYGRIDLLIVDPSRKRLIAIENKVLAEIGLRENHGTQLDLYEKALALQFPDFERLLVLLSYVAQEQTPASWICASFASLRTALKKDTSQDPIVEEYRRLLISMHIGASIQDLRSIERQLNSAEHLSLVQMQQLEGYLHAIRSI